MSSKISQDRSFSPHISKKHAKLIRDIETISSILEIDKTTFVIEVLEDCVPKYLEELRRKIRS